MAEKLKETLLKWNTPRRIVQLLSFILFSAMIFNIAALPLLFPVLWTWGYQPNAVGDAFTAIQLVFYNAAFPWLALVSFLVAGVLIGKAMCGWICPFGFIQDLLVFVKAEKREFSLRTHDTLIKMKYLVLGIASFISITFAIAKAMAVSANYESGLGIFVKVPFTAISPAEALFGALPNLINNVRLGVVSDILALPALSWAQLVIMVIVLALAVYVPRGWCRYLCPHGAIMAIMNHFSFIGLRRDPVKCAKGGCRLCVQVCPTRVPILELPWQKFSDSECIYCMKCVDACKDKAIKPTYP
jgi:polyferredoxin